MKKLSVFFIIFSIFLGSCQFSPKKTIMKDDIIYIDISKNYPNKRIIAEKIEYVPLETSKEVLLDKSAILHYVSEFYFLIIEKRRGNIFVFGRNGKIVSQFNHYGKGPGEYSTMSDVVFDEKNEEIFVFNNFGGDGSGLIFVYSIDGQYRRTMKYPSNFHLKAYNFDDKILLVYDMKNIQQNKNNYNKNPYMLLSKKDGSIVSTLEINLPVRYSDRVYNQITDDSGRIFEQVRYAEIFNRRHYGEDFIIGDMSSDTIYLLTKNRDLLPYIIRTPSIHLKEPHVTFTPVLLTEKFFVFYIIILDYIALKNENRLNPKILMYEFETNKIYNINKMEIQYDVNIVQKNIIDARLVDSYRLKESHNKWKSNKKEDLDEEEMKRDQVVSSLKEEDNPVVIIYKL